MTWTSVAVCKVCGAMIPVGENTDRTLGVMSLHIKTRHASTQEPPNEFFTLEVHPLAQGRPRPS
jgi:hypothetical protein